MGKEHNRAAAFLEFSKGATLEEISHALAIPLDHLKRWHRNESWQLIAPQITALTVQPTTSSVEAERARERIKENRERNVAIFAKLQEDLLETVEKMRDGTLTTEKVFANGLRVTVDPSLRDRCDLALYAKNVAEGSYRALGDIETAKNAHADSGLPSAGQITIILPPLLAAPRERVTEGQIIEIEASTVDPEAPPPLGNGSLHQSPTTSN